MNYNLSRAIGLKAASRPKVKSPLGIGIGGYIAGIWMISTYVFSFERLVSTYRIFFIASLILFAAFFWEFVVKKRKIRLVGSVKLYMLWALWAGLTIAMHPNNPMSENGYYGGFGIYLDTIKIVMITFVLSNLIRNRNQFLLLLWAIIISMVIIFIVNYESITAVQSFISQFGHGARLSGTIKTNLFSLAAVIGIWASLALYNVIERGYRYLCLISIPFSLVVVLLTGSVKGMLAIPLLIFFVSKYYYLPSGKKDVWHRLILFVMVLVVFFASIIVILKSPFGYRLINTFEWSNEGTSIETRSGMVRAGMDMWMDAPILGHGYDQFRFQAFQYGARPDFCSFSTPIELLTCTGLVGFLLYASALFLSYSEIRRALKMEIPSKDKTLLRFGICILLIICFFNLFAVLDGCKITWPLLGALAGYTKNLSYRNRRMPEPI